MGMRPSASQRGCLLLGRCPNTSLERAVLTSLPNSLQAVRPLRRRSWGQLGLRSGHGLLNIAAIRAAAALAVPRSGQTGRPLRRRSWGQLGLRSERGLLSSSAVSAAAALAACRPTLRADWKASKAKKLGPTWFALRTRATKQFGRLGSGCARRLPSHAPGRMGLWLSCPPSGPTRDFRWRGGALWGCWCALRERQAPSWALGGAMMAQSAQSLQQSSRSWPVNGKLKRSSLSG